MKVSRRDGGGSRGGGETSGGSSLVAASASGAEAKCTSVHVQSNSASSDRPGGVGLLLSAMACLTGQIKKDMILLGKCQIEYINLANCHLDRHTHTYTWSSPEHRAT